MQSPIDRRRVLLGSIALFGAAGPALSADPYAASSWRKLSDAEWRKRLPRAAYEVLRHEDTERPGSSALLAEKRKGTFVCAGCGTL